MTFRGVNNSNSKNIPSMSIHSVQNNDNNSSKQLDNSISPLKDKLSQSKPEDGGQVLVREGTYLDLLGASNRSLNPFQV